MDTKPEITSNKRGAPNRPVRSGVPARGIPLWDILLPRRFERGSRAAWFCSVPAGRAPCRTRMSLKPGNKKSSRNAGFCMNRQNIEPVISGSEAYTWSMNLPLIIRMHRCALPLATQLCPSSPRKYPSAHEQLSFCPPSPSMQKCSQPPFSSRQVSRTVEYSKSNDSTTFGIFK